MAPTQRRHIRADEPLDPSGEFRPDDALLSLGDIAFAGVAMAGASEVPEAFAAHITCLSHIVTRIVLSERLVFLIDPEDKGPWTTQVTPLLLEHCETITIDQDHPIPYAAQLKAYEDETDVLGDTLPSEMRSAVQRYAPWVTADLAKPWAAEYASSLAMAVPLAPNPFLSEPLGRHVARALGTDEALVRYVEDLRRATTQETNLLRKLAIFDVQIPAIFSAALRESRTPADLIAVAAQMHDEAKPFRDWCRNLDATPDPKTYNDQLRAAQRTLDKLGRSLRIHENERMQVPLPGGFHLPSETLQKLVSWMNVDVRFLRPRQFLLNLLASARQVARLEDELTRVFGTAPGFTKEAANRLIEISEPL